MRPMLVAIFRAAPRQRPQALLEVEFAPYGVRQLVAPAPEQQEQFEEGGERAADSIASAPEQRDFVVVEIALALSVFFLADVRIGDAECRVDGDNVLAL